MRKTWLDSLDRKFTKGILVVYLLIAIVIIAFLGSWFWMDHRAVEAKEPEGIAEQLQKEADDSIFRVRVNTEISLEKAGNEAALYIRNIEENQLDTYVELISLETDEVFYQSKTLKPGESVEKDVLENPKKAGVYPSIARFYVLDKEEIVSTIDYEIAIEVKED